jgi:hypothetical protein
MCDMVGADFKKIDFSTADWFQEYKWTQQQEAEFRGWFYKLLKNDAAARKEMLEHPAINSKTYIDSAVSEFIFQYGWSLED